MLPALMGVSLIPLTYLTLRALGTSVTTATLGGILVTFENGLIAQSRLILLDSPLIFFTYGSDSPTKIITELHSQQSGGDTFSYLVYLWEQSFHANGLDYSQLPQWECAFLINYGDSWVI
jgi:hypothetical protein